MTNKNEEKDVSKKIREIYRYDEMSNKVLKADKRLQVVQTDPIKDAEMSTPKSMSGRISAKEMGMGSRNDLSDSDREKAKKEADSVLNRQERRVTRFPSHLRTSNVLDLGNASMLNYSPNDAENVDTYGEILQWVSDRLGTDIPHDIIMSTADILIRILKSDENYSDASLSSKRQKIEENLEIKISLADFNDLVRLTKKITDFNVKSSESNDQNIPVLGDSDSEPDEQRYINTLEQQLSDLEDEISTENLPKDDAEKRDEYNEDEKEVLIFSTSNDGIPPIYLINEAYVGSLIKRETNSSKVQDDLQQRIIHELETTEYDSKKLRKTLSELLDFEHLKLSEFILKHQSKLLWGLRLSRCEEESIPQLLDEMLMKGLDDLVREYERNETAERKRKFDDVSESYSSQGLKSYKKRKPTGVHRLPPILELDSSTFAENPKLMTVSKVSLPEGSFKRVKPTYDEIHIPPPQKATINYELLPISSLPDWARNSFPSAETDTFNAIQSKVFDNAFHSDDNLLVCAPTGAGKTNIAMLTVLQTMSAFFDTRTQKVDLKRFKVVYIAPLKALVQEQVREFQRRLSYLGIKVAELTGDTRLTKQQIAETQILVTTPEKWDIITRKMDESSFAQLVRLIIIDEVHLLHDQRGPVLESIVARTLWSAQVIERPRLVALSATLPNYRDVARFLRVPEDHVFYFSSSFRPCPLAQQFCGVKEKSPLKRRSAMNDACYDKVVESLTENHQIIVFVHSRKDTIRTAKWLKDKLLENDQHEKLLKSSSGSKAILESESENVESPALKPILKYGIGIHHAGLSKNDRALSEDLFADGVLQILVSTATLAWGVNLPAHTVIIKGTDVYSPEKGDWEQLSPQDILQMLGRAGRPRYDTNGEGIIITNQSDVQYYLAVLNQQLPIESRFVSKLIDNINAEVVSGSIKSRADAVDWLSFTYLYVRMLTAPELYNVTIPDDDFNLYSYRESLVHTAFHILHEQGLILYNPEEALVEPTDLGRIASYFYINYSSMNLFSRELSGNSALMDVFRVFSMADEFKYISTRIEERRELKELFEKVPIPIKDDIESPLTKINVLLQAYISKLSFDGFALNSDMVFVHQNAGRLLRAMYEVCLKKSWAKSTRLLLTLCKSVERRMWITNSPLRQFRKCPLDVIKRTEASNLPWTEYLKLSSPMEVGRTIRSEKHSKLVFDLLQRFPKISLNSNVQPITASLISFEVEVLGNWLWDSKVHGSAEAFILLVEDTDGNEILYSQSFLLTSESIGREQIFQFSIQLTPSQQKRLPPNYFISVISEKWLHSEFQLATSMSNVQMPKKFPPPTDLEDLPLVSTAALENEEFSSILSFEAFNKIQSNIFDVLYHSNENIFIGATKGSGKTSLAEVAIMNIWRQNKGRILYICPSQVQIDRLYEDWNHRLSKVAGGKVIHKLGDNTPTNLRLINTSHLILSTPEQFDLVSRRWRQRKSIHALELLIFDDAHQVGNGIQGAVYENVISRMMFISIQLEKSMRIVALSTCLSNARDFSDWIGVKKENIYNFSPEVRINPLQVHLQAFNIGEDTHATIPMIDLAFKTALETMSSNSTAIIYVPTRKECIRVFSRLSHISKSNRLEIPEFTFDELQPFTTAVHEKALKNMLANGVGMLYKAMDANDRRIIVELYQQGILSLLLIERECHDESLTSTNIVILGTQFFESTEQRYVNYSVNELLEMVGNAKSTNMIAPAKVTVLTTSNRKNYYKKFLSESLPIESFMYFYLHDTFINEINNKIIRSKQDCIDWITYTYFFRRIHANPSFYGVKDSSSHGISAFLTELVESTLKDLVDASLIELDMGGLPEQEDEQNGESENIESIEPLNGALICSHYQLSFYTMHSFSKSLSRNSTLRDIVEILAGANEFTNLPAREDDYSKLLKLHNLCPLKFSGNARTEFTKFKVFVLLQAYFSRLGLSLELQQDLASVLKRALPLINAIVDLLASEGYLNATIAMDVSQMLVQAVWDVDSPLRQIPFFDDTILAKCSEKKIETVYDIMALEDEDREYIMELEHNKLITVANFINNYPNIEMKYSLDTATPIKQDTPRTLTVQLTKDDVPETLDVVSERFPYDKQESWWIVIGSISKRELYAIKKVSLAEETQSFDVEFTLNEKGSYDLTAWSVCDSYLDADKEISFNVEVV
ncbi:hypothetical protein KAFR_0B02580 [Kazachstania africana CBS 2517]|uniref:U5 small nuclear ribonucleoprotein 200 kDa helicase n=1 Tax=Kazachstania africana (strain ATCC 22294 / BCRC 22015 / CBS 2517 / CECT 1963 / NBRC 1671 / NRRL Y-8276) TaxID=1071382 RepID=H2AQA5_KAZAF|nr:hypothetical protein KAFR_0B02580 [Kazachstania africana CBS 2517]CCF56555.1 hypothetical protein KAFR_0B02580 [Kazachstania africana CBS 2517]